MHGGGGPHGGGVPSGFKSAIVEGVFGVCVDESM